MGSGDGSEDREQDIRLENQLCFALYSASLAFSRRYKPLLDPLGLTYPQYLAMMALWETDHQPVKALGEKLSLDSGTLSPLLKRLEQAGYVTRRRGSKDERQVKISLTEEGSALRHKAQGVASAIGVAIGCTHAEIADLRDELKALRGRLLAGQG